MGMGMMMGLQMLPMVAQLGMEIGGGIGQMIDGGGNSSQLHHIDATPDATKPDPTHHI